MDETGDDRDLLLSRLADEFAARHRAGERPAVREYCERHPSLAEDIRAIFPAMVELEHAKDDTGTAEVPAAAMRQLGDFRLLREIGRGGMGVVYEAEQITLGRRVAIKLLPATVINEPTKRLRFEREAKAAARLHHTNIVPVHGCGEHESTPYYVMQYIPGLGLDAVIEELARSGPGAGRKSSAAFPGALSMALARSLQEGDSTATLAAPTPFDAPTLTLADGAMPPPAARPPRSDSSGSVSASSIQLPGQSQADRSGSKTRSSYWASVARIGVQVAGALAYAHKLGILHRDIKPGNLLLDLDGIVWVTDFGLAKSDDADNLTQAGDIVGTLRYMPPEAFEGKSDARSDIYSLGLTLFELVALRPAYEERDRNRLIRQVTTGEPPRLRRLCPGAPRDLVTIVEKSIDRDPARRYQTAAALADDLQRFLDGRPVEARRATELERAWKWAQRRPAMAGLIAALFLCLLGGAITSTIFALRADGFARDAQARESEATLAMEAARRNAEQARTTRNAAARQAAGLLLDRGIEDARGGEPARALHLFVKALKALPADDAPSAPLERAIRLNITAWAATVPALEQIWPQGPLNFQVAYSPDGEHIVMAVGANAIRCHRTSDGQPVGPPIGIATGINAGMAFAADDRSLWVASPGSGKVVDAWAIRRFDPVTGGEIQKPVPSPGPVDSLVGTPDGRHLVGTVLGLHPEDRGPQATATGERKWCVKSVVVWEAASGRIVRSVPVEQAHYQNTGSETAAFLSLGPDGRTVTVWYPRGTGLEGLTFGVEGHDAPNRLGRHPCGNLNEAAIHFQNHLQTALVLRGGELFRWSASHPGELGAGVPSPFRQMCTNPAADGRSVISPDERRAFDVGAWPPRPSGLQFHHPAWQRTIHQKAESPDGRFATTWIWLANGGGRLWRLPRPLSRPPLAHAAHAGRSENKEFYFHAKINPSADTALLWYRGDTKTDPYPPFNVRLLDIATGAMRDTKVRHAAINRDIAFSPDSCFIATGGNDGTARVWDVATGDPASPPLRHDNWVSAVAFNPDGSTLAAGDFGPAGLIKLWNWRTGRMVRPPLRHDDIVLNVAYTPDGRHLTALKADDWSGKAEIVAWDVETGTVAFRVGHHFAPEAILQGCQFRPDGRAVVSRDGSGLLRLWEMPTGRLLGERPADGLGAIRFAPDGRTIAAKVNLGVRLFDGATLAPLPAGFLTHPDPIRDVAFSPDGTLLLTGHENGSAQLWDVATRKPIGPPSVLNGPIRGIAFGPDGRRCVAVAADGTVRRWAVPAAFAEPDLDRLAERLALMTGLWMDDSHGLDFVPVNEWTALRTKLAGAGSTALVPLPPDADWHDASATDAERDGDVFGGTWHLDRLAKLRPADWTIPARRGRLLLAAGRPVDAAAAYVAARTLAPNARVLSDWLRACSSDEEASERLEPARWNLERAVALNPDDWTLYARRALLKDSGPRADADLDHVIRCGANDLTTIVGLVEVAARRGDWKRAAALFDALAPDVRIPMEVQSIRAIVNLKNGNVTAYRSVCKLLARELVESGTAHHASDSFAAARALAFGENAVEDLSPPLQWIDNAIARCDKMEKEKPARKDAIRRERHLYLKTRGALLYRAGRFEEAAAALREGMSVNAANVDFLDWALVALAEHRLGHREPAEVASVKAREAHRQKK